jgi:hypothetical protein
VTKHLRLEAFSFGLLACSSGARIGQEATTTGTGGAATATSSSSALASSTGGSVPSCDPTTDVVEIDGDGPVQHYDVSCGPSAGTTGFLCDPAHLTIIACTKGPSSQVLFIDGGLWANYPGQTANAIVSYLRNGVGYGSTSAMLNVTTAEAYGGLIAGTFTANVVPAGGADAGPPIALYGTFHLCDNRDVEGVCASPDTPIATPTGSVPIADLGVGDLVYSVEHEAIVTVPIVRVSRTPVMKHHVMRIALEDGAVLEISRGHPTADGRTFAVLRPGDLLDGQAITSAELIPYEHAFTYDILPASETGTYYAGGALIGSTLKR